MPDYYYRALLTLPTHRLEPLLALADATHLTPKAQDFMAITDDVDRQEEADSDEEVVLPPHYRQAA